MDKKKKMFFALLVIFCLSFTTVVVANLKNDEVKESENENIAKAAEKKSTGENSNSNTVNETSEVTKEKLSTNNSNKLLKNTLAMPKSINTDVTGPEITFTGSSKSYKSPSNENITIVLKDRSEIGTVSYLITESYNNKGNYGEEVAAENIVKNSDGSYSVVIDVAGKNGGYYVFVKATDKLGNVTTTKSGHFYIDTTKPVLSFEGGSKSSKNHQMLV